MLIRRTAVNSDLSAGINYIARPIRLIHSNALAVAITQPLPRHPKELKISPISFVTVRVEEIEVTPSDASYHSS